MIRTPNGFMSEEEVLALFEQVGFTPPPGTSMQDAFGMLLHIARQQQQEEERAARPVRGRTAVHPNPQTADAAASVLGTFGAACAPVADSPVGCEITGLDIAAMDGALPPELAGALEILMAVHGFVLLRGQGQPQEESGVAGTYLTAEQQCRLSECFGAGALHSTHGVHPEAPCRDIFRLSNDPNHGFNSVGPEWHNDGSFCREVFGHVVYHIVKAPSGAGDTRFAHLGIAFSKLAASVQARLRRCASVNSNGGAVHPLAAPHPISGRPSLYLHLGMTGAMLEVHPSAAGGGEGGSADGAYGRGGDAGLKEADDEVPPSRKRAGSFLEAAQERAADAAAGGAAASDAAAADAAAPPSSVVDLCGATTPDGLPKAKPRESARLGLGHVVAWRDAEMDAFFSRFSALLDHPSVSYSHKWAEGDVVIIDNLAVAHKAAPGAHTLSSGLRILHRSTILSSRAHDPSADLKLPHTLPTDQPCPFEASATWREGYVGFRWGEWEERSVPH